MGNCYVVTVSILLTRGYLKIANNCVAVDTLKQHWQEAKFDVFLLSKCNAYKGSPTPQKGVRISKSLDSSKDFIDFS